MQKGEKKVVLGGGESFQQAFHNVFIAPLQAREHAAEEAAKELSATSLEPAR